MIGAAAQLGAEEACSEEGAEQGLGVDRLPRGSAQAAQPYRLQVLSGNGVPAGARAPPTTPGPASGKWASICADVPTGVMLRKAAGETDGKLCQFLEYFMLVYSSWPFLLSFARGKGQRRWSTCISCECGEGGVRRGCRAAPHSPPVPSMHVHKCTHTHMCTHTRTHMCTHIRTHTRTHTHGPVDVSFSHSTSHF